LDQVSAPLRAIAALALDRAGRRTELPLFCPRRAIAIGDSSFHLVCKDGPGLAAVRYGQLHPRFVRDRMLGVVLPQSFRDLCTVRFASFAVVTVGRFRRLQEIDVVLFAVFPQMCRDPVL
jgi:hypothetical protein